MRNAVLARLKPRLLLKLSGSAIIEKVPKPSILVSGSRTDAIFNRSSFVSSSMAAFDGRIPPRPIEELV